MLVTSQAANFDIRIALVLSPHRFQFEMSGTEIGHTTEGSVAVACCVCILDRMRSVGEGIYSGKRPDIRVWGFVPMVDLSKNHTQ